MSFSQKLNAMDQLELDDWLTQKGLQLNKRNCRHVLTDVSTVARIISNVCPKLVNMGNYITSDNRSLSKLVNWETFNLKVLRRMGVGLTYPELRNVAHGKMNALKLLLLNLMHLERDKVKLKEINEQRRQTTRKERQVPYSAYEDLALEIQKKDKYICSISHKLRYLESLLLVKEELINKLTQQLRTLIVQSQLINC